MSLLVDFSNIIQNDVGNRKTITSKYDKNYDKTTQLFYKTHRIRKTDPITYEELNDDNAFIFKEMWDPYTGERKGDDPYGPLYINPINILKFIYENRLRGLWIEDESGDYQGCYGEYLGKGENLQIVGRGEYPEKYIFRLPIQDCYLTDDHNYSFVTMGPKLSVKEICKLDRLLVKYWSNDMYFKKVYGKIGTLYKLKCCYDVAISKQPSTMDLSFVTVDKRRSKNNIDEYLNRAATDVIRRMT